MKSFSVGSQAFPTFIPLRPTQISLITLLNILWPFSFPWPPYVLLGTFQIICGAGADRAFYSEPELEPSKRRRLRLRKRQKSNNINKCEITGLILIKAFKFVMSGAGVGTFCLDLPGHFIRSRKWSRPKLFQLCIPVFKISARQGWMQGRLQSTVHW